jgi:hypothetical protein
MQKIDESQCGEEKEEMKRNLESLKTKSEQIEAEHLDQMQAEEDKHNKLLKQMEDRERETQKLSKKILEVQHELQGNKKIFQQKEEETKKLSKKIQDVQFELEEKNKTFQQKEEETRKFVQQIKDDYELEMQEQKTKKIMVFHFYAIIY